MPAFVVADGNNGVNIKKRNIGMPCSNTVCATFNRELAYEVGRVIAEEAKEKWHSDDTCTSHEHSP